MIHTIEII